MDTIKNEEEYELVMARIDKIFNAKKGTPKGDELDLLVAKVVLYEDIYFPITDENAL